MTNKNLIRKERGMEKRNKCKWYEFEQHTKLGFNSSKTANEDICNALMQSDPELKRLGATTFDYWTSTHSFQEEQRAYVQTYRGARIIDTRLIFKIGRRNMGRTDAENYELTKKGDLYEIVPVSRLEGSELAYVTFVYKRLIANPAHNRLAKTVNDGEIESLIDREIDVYRREKGVDSVIREKTSAKLNVWFPESCDMSTGTQVELHQGLCAYVGTTYFEGNEFPQFLYFIMDRERDKVVYIKTMPAGGIIHATRVDGSGVTSRPTVTDRNEVRFVETHSKLRPGQIRAQLE